MELFGYITVSLLLLSGAVLLWRNRRLLGVGSLHQPQRRLGGYTGLVLLLHGLVIGWSVVPTRGCLHERPMGVVNGSGDQIAKGSPTAAAPGPEAPRKQARVTTNLQQVMVQQQRQLQNDLRKRMISREGLLQIVRQNADDPGEDRPQALGRAIDSVAAAGGLGLPGGSGFGATAAGSPFGTRIGGELWLYRVRHSGENWDANPKALPVLLQEVKKAFPGLKVSSKQEVITLAELPKHRAEFFPSLLFFTGTGSVEGSDADKKNLRDYLQAGGLVVADSSGGNFEDSFKQFIRQATGRGRIRAIEFDHEVFRGDKVLYQLSHGCPIYRAHGKQDDAEGMFADDGRLMVFISPGDLGSAWASVAMGRSRTSVERAFQMGTNLVSWSLNTVHDRRAEKKQ